MASGPISLIYLLISLFFLTSSLFTLFVFHRLMRLWTSRCMSRTAQKQLCRHTHHAAPLYPAKTALRVPAVAGEQRETLLHPMSVYPLPTQHIRAPCRSLVPSTYSGVTHRHTPPGETQQHKHRHASSIKQETKACYPGCWLNNATLWSQIFTPELPTLFLIKRISSTALQNDIYSHLLQVA